MLSDRQRGFVEGYVATLCATTAARKAGYSERSAKSQGSRLLTHPAVKAAIADALSKRSADAGLEAKDVIARVRYVMNSDPGEQWRSGDILKAIELAGRYCKLWGADQAEVVGLTLEQLVPKRRPQASDSPDASPDATSADTARSPVTLETLVPARTTPASEVEVEFVPIPRPAAPPFAPPQRLLPAPAPRALTSFDPWDYLRKS